MEGLEGMKQTNLAAMLSALRSTADGCKQEGNTHFAAGPLSCRPVRFAASLTRTNAAGDMEAAVEAYTRAADMSDPVRPSGATLARCAL